MAVEHGANWLVPRKSSPQSKGTRAGERTMKSQSCGTHSATTNIAELRSGEDVYMMEPFGSDVSFCDIGEENPDFDVQTRRMMRVLNMLERWRPYSTM